MKISECANAPQWLRDADTVNANVEITSEGTVIWHAGVWYGGDWLGGNWCDTRIDRLLFMAAACGIVFDADGYAVAYRSTLAGGRGRYTTDFVQPSGEYFDADAKPAGKGVCVKGIHVCSQATALTYFGVDESAELWRVRFKREDLLDCDWQKARIRGGVFERVSWPFFKAPALEAKKARE